MSESYVFPKKSFENNFQQKKIAIQKKDKFFTNEITLITHKSINLRSHRQINVRMVQSVNRYMPLNYISNGEWLRIFPTCL